MNIHVQITDKGKICLPFILEMCRKYPKIKIWDAQEIANSLYDEFFVGGADDGRSMMELYETYRRVDS